MNIVQCKQSPPITKYGLHSHLFWEIVCIESGEVATAVGTSRYTLTKGDIMLIPPNTNHKGNSKCPFVDLSVLVEEVDFGEFTVIKDYRGDIAFLISVIIRVCTEREGNYKSVANSLLAAVCEMIKQEIGYSSEFSPIEKIKNEIYENLSNTEFSLSAAIAGTGFDKDYFRRRFKAETGKTPLQYLTDIRIAHAKVLLRDEKFYSISCIADSCGFSDSLYFSTCFKKHTGVSPLDYRKKQNI